MKKTLAFPYRPLIGVVAFVFFGFAVACQSEEEEDLAERSLDEHACDEAAAKLAQCCAGVRKEMIACRATESSGGCDSRRTSTEVLIPMRDAAHCILNATCQELNDQGICAALPSAVAESYSTSGGDPSTHREAVSVCPALRSATSSSSSSSSSSSGSTLPPPEPPKDEPVSDDGMNGTGTCSCEGDAATCSWYLSQLQCESMGCTWTPK